MRLARASQNAFIAALAVSIAIALIWLSTAVSAAFDVTANKRHQLTKGTIAAVQALQGAVTIQAVMGPEPQTRASLSELVSRYQAHNAQIELQFINPDTDPGRARELNAAVGGELIINGMGREQRLTSVSERLLTGALRQLNRDGERTLAFVIGHEERSPASEDAIGWQNTTQRLASIGLNSVERSLVTDPRIENDVDVLVIADARRRYFPGEIASVLEHVNRGGNLLWLTETQLDNKAGSGLNALALELGIDTLPGTVIDKASLTANTNAPSLVIVNRFPKHPINAGLNAPVLLPDATALSVTALAGQTILPLLQTAEQSWTELGKLEGAVGFDEGTDEVSGPLILGVTIERLINGQQQRIAVIGDADFAANQFVGNGANQRFIESLMLWLSGETAALEFVTEAAPDTQLILSKRAIIILSAVVLILIPLVLLLFAGVIAWRKRH